MRILKWIGLILIDSCGGLVFLSMIKAESDLVSVDLSGPASAEREREQGADREACAQVYPSHKDPRPIPKARPRSSLRSPRQP